MHRPLNHRENSKQDEQVRAGRRLSAALLKIRFDDSLPPTGLGSAASIHRRRLSFNVMQKEITDEELGEAGLRLVKLLQRRDFKGIESEFGYALSNDRLVDQAIAQDLQRELDGCGSTGEIDQEKIEIRVSHFDSNSSHLKSLVECYCELTQENGILIELVLTESGSLCFEDISSYQIKQTK